jgi:WD40 repeat protein
LAYVPPPGVRSMDQCPASLVTIVSLVIAAALVPSCSDVRQPPVSTPSQYDPTATIPAASPVPPTSIPSTLGIAQPPVGLVYQVGASVFRIDEAGDPQALPLRTTEGMGSLSPDGRYILHWGEAGLIGISDADKGTYADLSAYGDPPLVDAIWSATVPPTLLTKAGEMGYCSYGVPTLVKPDGSGVQALTELSADCFGMALSPDGSVLAFSSDRPYILPVGGVATPLNYNDFALPPIADLHIQNPSWSPDSNRIAWNILGTLDGKAYHGLVVFHLQTSEGILCPLPQPCAEGLAWPSWNPVGDQIAVGNCGLGLTVISSDGEVLFERPRAFDHEWSPDGQYLSVLSPDGTVELVTLSGTTFSTIQTPLGSPHGFYPLRSAWSPASDALLIYNGTGTTSQPVFLFTMGDRTLRRVDLPTIVSILGWAAPQHYSRRPTNR